MEKERPRIVDLEEELRWHEIDFNEPSIVEIPDGDTFYHRVKYHLPNEYTLELVGIKLDEGRKEIKESDTYRSGSIISPPFRTKGGLVLMAQGIAEHHSVGFDETTNTFRISEETPEVLAAGIKPVTSAYESFLKGKENYMQHLKTLWK